MKHALLLFVALFLCGLNLFAQGPHDVQLYGMTQYGGTAFRGTIFHYTPSTQTYTVDYEFQIKASGKAPKCEIVSGNNGKYYGTTTEGGAFGAGVLFSWDSATGEYQEPYHFRFTEDGADARGGMVLYQGKLYGMTNRGGAHDFGVIYEYNLSTGAFSKKVDFDSTNGRNPQGSLLLADSVFYGFTFAGGSHDKGVLFTWNPASNQLAKKYDFDSAFGANPVGRLTPYNNGKLYAMTMNGGSSNNGIIYEWNPVTNVVAKKYDFNNLNGIHPMGHLSLYNNRFYGITNGGGIHQAALQYPAGVIFEYNPFTNVFTKKRDLAFFVFGQSRAGSGSYGSLILRGNVFWGTTGSGAGGFFSWNPATNVYADKAGNMGAAQCEADRLGTGTKVYGALLASGSLLLGSYAEDGGHVAGAIFKFSPDSNRIADAVHMQYSDGAYPKGSLTQVGHKLYGCTFQGGRNHSGNIFEWDLHTKKFAERFTFNPYSTGSLTKGGPVFWNGKLYGINSYGVRFGQMNYEQRRPGDFFSWDPATNQYQSHIWEYSIGTPTLYKDRFYIASPATNSIVRFDPSNDSIQYMAVLPPNSGTFNNYQDYISANCITYGGNGKFYGLTPAKLHSGATPFRGTVYEWDTLTSEMAHKIDFVDTIGAYPTGDLIKVGEEFYGLTTGIGLPLNSTLFTYSPATNTLKKKAEISQWTFGTPTYSKGKIYFSNEGAYSMIFEYDPVLDTNYQRAQVQIPQAFSGTWNNNCGKPPIHLKLLEVIPNEDPVLSNVPPAQSVCSQQPGTANFTILDADNDTIHFTITSSDTILIHPQNISVTNIGSEYSLLYVSSANQSGSDTIQVMGNDGYGGSVQFSMVVNVKTLPNLTVSQHSDTLSAQENDAGFQWIDCLTNTAVAGANNPVFIAATNGVYAAVITKNNCSDTSACFTVTTAGIADQFAKQVLIVQPNPAQDAIDLRFAGNANVRIQSVTITNLIGETLLEKTDLKGPIRISTLQSGIYFVRVQSGGRVYAGKLVKE